MELELSVNVQYAGRRAESIREVLLQLNQPVWTRLVLRQVLPQLQQISPTEPEALVKLLHETALSKDKELSCSICMGVVDGLTAELPCGHKFHPNCARSWLERRNTCPLCRFQMPKAYTGTYAVAAVSSVLILPQEHQGLTPAQESLQQQREDASPAMSVWE
ncbi:hypothetical protein BBJ28_00001547 [Nothophytophthora sp. Chile5]|nr:hypothetical protein BBJ28_00001547 [Nothophytophthora sp. Chile5]